MNFIKRLLGWPKPPPPPPKNKRNGVIAAMVDHYLKIIDSGLDVQEFRPEPPAGAMAGNSYALEAYTNKLIAFARAIAINQERNQYFNEDQPHD